MQVRLTEIEHGSWNWEVFDNLGHRIQWGFAENVAKCMVDVRLWYYILFTQPIDAACECGGYSGAGWQAFAPGHSHWCPVAYHNLLYTEAP